VEAGALQAPAGLNRISIGTPLLRLRTDEQLVALFRSGNEEAFQVIFDRYRQRLFAYTRQMLSGSRQDAEDALQDVFMRAYGALRANDRPVSLRAWLYRVAHNRCIDQLRRPTPASPDVFDMSRSPLRDPVEESARREDLRRLVADVRRLPEAQRSALLMREMDGLSYQELADALDVTVPAIKSLLVRARIGLVEAIEARDTACVEIRNDLLASYDKGVRATGKARRHLRDCAGCREYRTDLRGVQRGLSALAPSGSPLTVLAKLFGLGGGAGGAAAGTGAVVGGGGAAVVGGGAATVTACKVAAIVCSAALVTGAATQVEHAFTSAVASDAPAAAVASSTRAVAPAAGTAHTLKAATQLASLRSAAAGTTVRANGASGAAASTRIRHRLRLSDASAAVAAAEADAYSPDDEVYADPVVDPTGPAATVVAGGAKAPDDLPAADATTPAASGPTPTASGTAPTSPATGSAGATGTSSPSTSSTSSPGASASGTASTTSGSAATSGTASTSVTAAVPSPH
jgi:RNA polymerase sigma factor (sigma-70 family)